MTVFFIRAEAGGGRAEGKSYRTYKGHVKADDCSNGYRRKAIKKSH
jgi:hypothetical protein